eukprot:gene20459-14995_t
MKVVLLLVYACIGFSLAFQHNISSSSRTHRSLTPAQLIRPAGHQLANHGQPLARVPPHQINPSAHVQHSQPQPQSHNQPPPRTNPPHEPIPVQVASPVATEQSLLIRQQLQRAVAHKDFAVVPIIYIVYGKLPDYLHFSIEVTRRTNRIVV